MKTDGSKNHDSPKTGGEDAQSSLIGFSPSDVACRIFGTDAFGAAFRQISQRTKQSQKDTIIESGILPSVPFPKNTDAKGTEHVVRFRGARVEKHQHSDGWVAALNQAGMLTVAKATPIEYLRRLHLQNELFGDDIQVVGLTRQNRFATSQPTLRGSEPTENDIRDVLQDAGWQRIPIHKQDLPHQLMGSAWWHAGEELILLDARKPNFKETDFGALPIDLILCDITQDFKKALCIAH